MSLLSGDFLTTDNLLNVGVQAAVTAILAFGVTFVIVSAGIDLSVGSVAALSATVLAWSATFAGPAGVARGRAGRRHRRRLRPGQRCARSPTASCRRSSRPSRCCRSAAAWPWSSPRAARSPSPTRSPHLGDTLGGWLPVPVLVMIVMGADHRGRPRPHLHRPRDVRDRRQRGGGPALRHPGQAPEARHLRPVRRSSRRSRASCWPPGWPPRSRRPPTATNWTRSPRSSSAAPASSGGVGKASGTLIGALILAVLRNGLNLLSVSAFWQQVVIGVVIALAVLLDTLRRRAGAAPRAPARPVRPSGTDRKDSHDAREVALRRRRRRRRRRSPRPPATPAPDRRREHQGGPVALHPQQPVLRAAEGGRTGRGEEARAST